MKPPRYEFEVQQEARVRVWAYNADHALELSVRAITGPRWQHRLPWRLLPWRARRVASVGEFHTNRLRGPR